MKKFHVDLISKYLIKIYKACDVTRPKFKDYLNSEFLEYLLKNLSQKNPQL